MKFIYGWTLFALLFVACGTKQEQKETILMGKIENSRLKVVKLLLVDETRLEPSERTTEYKANLNSDSTFRFDLILNNDVHDFKLLVGNKFIDVALALDDSVCVQIENNGVGVRFSGKGSEKNNFLQKCVKFPIEDSFKKQAQILLEAKAQDIKNENFYNFIELKQRINFWSRKIEIINQQDSFYIPKKAFFDNIVDFKNVEYPELLSETFYLNFLEKYLYYRLIVKQYGYDTNISSKDFEQERMREEGIELSKVIFSKELNELLSARYIYELVQNNDKNKYTSQWKNFQKNATNTRFKHTIEKKLAIIDSMETKAYQKNN